MKKENLLICMVLILTGLFSISLTLPESYRTSDTSVENNAAAKVFRLFYIDNSKPGLSSGLLDFVHDETDSLNDQPFLLYISNNDNPDFTKNNKQVKEQLAKLTEDYSYYPDCFYDKKNVLRLLESDNLNNLSSIKIYFVLTENYLRELLKDKPSYFLRFLPDELALLTKTAPEKIQVNICYSLAPDSKNEAEIKSMLEKVKFYDKDKYNNPIQYTIIQK